MYGGALLNPPSSPKNRRDFHHMYIYRLFVQINFFWTAYRPWDFSSRVTLFSSKIGFWLGNRAAGSYWPQRQVGAYAPLQRTSCEYKYYSRRVCACILNHPTRHRRGCSAQNVPEFLTRGARYLNRKMLPQRLSFAHNPIPSFYAVVVPKEYVFVN